VPSSGPAAAEPDVEAVPDAASEVFGDRLPLAEQFAQALVTGGVVRGVIGPREPVRIWSRHLLNCAVVSELFAVGTRVVDVGSGAGLPGIALAIRRPDLSLDLVEPLLRRVEFLNEVVAALGMSDQVRVVRGRADEPLVRELVGEARWVTARAVAPLDRLVRWCLPLLGTDGRLALLKGSSAAEELERHRGAMIRAGGAGLRIVNCGVGLVEPSVAVVELGVAPRRASRRPTRNVIRKGKR
jgi:16S rRNA (guanine527-N7)-methyltransferase